MRKSLVIVACGLLLAGPASAVTLDLNVDLLQVTEATLTRSPDPLGANWEQTVSGGFFDSFALGPTAPHWVNVSIPWSTNNWTDFTSPLKEGAPVEYEFEASLGAVSQLLSPFGLFDNLTLTFPQTSGPFGGEGGSLEPGTPATGLGVNPGAVGPVELIILPSFDAYDSVDFVLSRSFSVGELGAGGLYFFLASTATVADYVFEDGRLTRIDATREGLLTQLLFEGDLLQQVFTPEGPLSNGDFVRDRSGLLFEVGSSVIPEPSSLVLLAMGLAGLAIRGRKRWS
jgi:hypothetical protein